MRPFGLDPCRPGLGALPCRERALSNSFSPRGRGAGALARLPHVSKFVCRPSDPIPC